MRKCWKRMAVAVLAAATAAVLPAQALAAEETVLPKNNPKEEVVYANLNADGSVKEINVVNIFDRKEKGQIIDYGSYESVRNMTTTDAIRYQDGMAVIDAGAGKLYYEGRMKEKAMPWKVSIRYLLDGREYCAEEIAGRSGKLEIRMLIRKNESCGGAFFEGYALQASCVLDTNKAANITAEGATVANVGSDKQLVYTILPGKGADIRILADVTDFEMKGLSINGVALNLNLEVDDEAFAEQIAELVEAIETLDDGAGGLQGGAASVKDGAGEVKDGMRKMQEGLQYLHTQSGKLADGSGAFKDALGQLQEKLKGASVAFANVSELAAASAAIKTGIGKIAAGTGALQQGVGWDAYKEAMRQNDVDVVTILQQNNQNTISSLENTHIPNLQNTIAQLKAAGQDTVGLESQLALLQNMLALLTGNQAAMAGMERYLTAIGQKELSGLLAGATDLQKNYADFDDKIAKLAEALGGLPSQMSSLSEAVNGLAAAYQGIDGGTAEVFHATGLLCDGAKELEDGMGKLCDGIATLLDGTVELKDGTAAFRQETAGMDAEISGKIDEMIGDITGGGVEMASFASPKNTEIVSVQFVMQCPDIKAAKQDAAEAAPAAKLNFWQKLFRLFGAKKE